MRNENGEKISQEQKQQIIRMIQRLQEMQELHMTAGANAVPPTVHAQRAKCG